MSPGRGEAHVRPTLKDGRLDVPVGGARRGVLLGVMRREGTLLSPLRRPEPAV